METRLHIIVAADRYGNIGYNNTIPWKLEGDLKRFKAVTMGHTVVVGRKTYESFGRALEGRTVIVVSSIASTNPDEIEKPVLGNYGEEIYLAPSLTEAIGCARRLGTYMDETPDFIHIYVAGGAQLYKEAWGIADKLHLTLVMNRPQTKYDTAIEDFNVKGWQAIDPAQRIDQDISGTGRRVLSHIYFTAVRVNPALKATSNRMHHPMCWVFDQLGRKYIDNLIDESNDAQLDRDIYDTANHPKTAGQKLTNEWLQARLNSTKLEDRDFFNAWTGGTPDLEKEFKVIQILTKACEAMKVPDRGPLNMPEFIGKVVSDLEAVTGSTRPLPDSMTWVGDDGVINTLSAPGIAAARQRGEHEGEGLIANTRARMTDTAVADLLKKAGDEQS